jgi:hypothetical protein
MRGRAVWKSRQRSCSGRLCFSVIAAKVTKIALAGGRILDAVQKDGRAA